MRRIVGRFPCQVLAFRRIRDPCDTGTFHNIAFITLSARGSALVRRLGGYGLRRGFAANDLLPCADYIITFIPPRHSACLYYNEDQNQDRHFGLDTCNLNSVSSKRDTLNRIGRLHELGYAVRFGTDCLLMCLSWTTSGAAEIHQLELSESGGARESRWQLTAHHGTVLVPRRAISREPVACRPWCHP